MSTLFFMLLDQDKTFVGTVWGTCSDPLCKKVWGVCGAGLGFVIDS